VSNTRKAVNPSTAQEPPDEAILKPEKKFQGRKLTTRDLPMIARLIASLGKEPLMEVYNTIIEQQKLTRVVDEKTGEVTLQPVTQIQLGVAVIPAVAKLLDSYGEATHKELVNFLASVYEMQPSAVEDLPLSTFRDIVLGLFSGPVGQTFFRSLSQLS